MSDRVEEGLAIPAWHAVRRQGSVGAGIQAGLLGGFAMLALLALCAGATGLGWLHPIGAMGATIGTSGTGAVVAGTALHLAVSGVLGIPLAAVLPDDFPPGSAAVVGAAYGILVAAVMTSLVVPAVSPGFRTAIQPAGGSWTLGHVVFGATLAVALALRRRASLRAAERPGAGAGMAQSTPSDRTP